jgi:ankyrin repeat protein
VSAVGPLLQALYAGKNEELETLLAEKPELNVFEAAALGRTDRLRELLDAERGLSVAFALDGFTALHLAAFFGHPEAAQVLVERGADVSAVAHNAMAVQPLHSAAAAGQTEIARLLLDRGADPNARQEGGFTPLHAASQNKDEELAELLLSRGADPEAAADDGRRAGDF